MDRGLEPAGALCELPHLFCGNSHSNAAFNFAPTLGYIGCPEVRVRHRLGLHAGGGWVVGVKIEIIFSVTDNGQ